MRVWLGINDLIFCWLLIFGLKILLVTSDYSHVKSIRITDFEAKLLLITDSHSGPEILLTTDFGGTPLRPAYTSRLMTKPTKWHVRPGGQISLGIRPVWSESSLSAWRNHGSSPTHWAHSEDSDETGRMPRLIWVFAGRTCHFVGFVTRRLT